ncbi:DUF6873 family GME fold protein [Clostridium taeniosporum]|uniref:DUF6873 domain-containing protein n=1 Tax=Clostridium taeniosporum TaxID=394958 RepID=A0A1D7XKW5_9CLOT|nr:hypothetical protein [Clostridium taeniosporum]AOR23978.1 hypothetical protein BGI42_09670 [Clostridium taeniosporum]
MYCFIDYRTTKEEINNLYKLNLEPILVPKSDEVYEAINGHPDIQLNILKNNSENKIIVHKNISSNFLNILNNKNIKYIVSESSLSNTYPKDIILNSLILDNYFIHNLKYSDNNLMLSQSDKIKINVNQGYTKCSILPIRDKALITSDIGIYSTLINYDFDVLLLPSGDILLPNLNYGFIGGTGGLISDSKIAFFGELSHYEWGNEVNNFLYKYDVCPIYLRKGKLIDRGSLLVL